MSSNLHAEATASWPGLADLAAQHLDDIGAVFGFAPDLDGVTFGSLNLYSRIRRGLSPTEIAEVCRAVSLATASLPAGHPTFFDRIADE